jgi:hypothetical protein
MQRTCSSSYQVVVIFLCVVVVVPAATAMKLFALFCLFVLGRADQDVFHMDQGYDDSTYGLYPVQHYKTTNVVSPRINVLRSNAECSELYTMLTPRGGMVSEASATILDHEGHLIWTVGGYNQIYNLMVQTYNGQQYLTFWAGNDAVGGHGAGFYYMLDTSYNEVMKIGAAGGLWGDLHEFRITEQGTAIFTVYEIVQEDLTSLGKPFIGPVWDCLIQEIDLATGELIFQWRALDHYNLTDTYRDIGGDGEEGRAFDFFHMNSIAKDQKGNYLTSSRYMHSITYIDGTTGEVIWILGGKRNMFEDLSSGKATDFAYQHDARWSDNFTTITMFDNGVDDPHPRIADTRGLRLKVDQEAMTVKLLTTYTNPHHIHGISQGSFQTLDSGNVIMGYGNSAAFTEYAYDGTVLCDTHFGPESRFGSAEVQSYRVYKFEWHATPRTNPDVVILKEKEAENAWSFYVSWNGATEVEEWVLQGSEVGDAAGRDGYWTDLEKRKKDEFEEQFELKPSYPRYLRIVGLNSEGETQGVGGPLDSKAEKVCYLQPVVVGCSQWLNRFRYGRSQR